MSENNTTGSTKPKRLLTQNSDLRRIGVFNWTLPAFVIEMPDGSHFNVCPPGGRVRPVVLRPGRHVPVQECPRSSHSKSSPLPGRP
ncbi:GP88 family protein [Streptomyces sp. NBC_00829]|uniref:GP88 family protein n=1 Tax=Streptomyces sp. NBC_00829 TaxID=2903679 RepID=UPI002F906AEF|nr:hypothetical protein OG293_39740 [Streptomyces sp. NBC_00829]